MPHRNVSASVAASTDVHSNTSAQNGNRVRPGRVPGRYGWFPFSRHTVIALGVAVACTVLGYFRYSPPAPLPASIPDDTFSAERAEPILKLLVGDGIPHPAGSEQIAIVRQRIIDFFAELDIEVEQHVTSGQYWRTGEVYPLVNLIASIPGSDPHATIALASHYDSVFAGPGAADDGVGVAVSLEIAKYFSANRPRNNLVFLITDGEELGMLGSSQFVNEHALADEIDVIINLEARGTKGPSLMFETGPASFWTIQQFASRSRRPFSSSLFFEIYKLLPNNTDFTRFREAGMEGFNFAFIGDVKHYHTPDDNYEMVDRGSMQHHGENAFELMKHLASLSPFEVVPGRAIYFDFLGLRVVYWHDRLAIPLALIPTVLIAGFVLMNIRRGTISISNLLQSGMIVIGLIFSIAVVGAVISFGLKWDGFFDYPWPASPVPIMLLFWMAGTTLVLYVGRSAFSGHAVAVYSVVWLGWIAILWLLTFASPGASYLFLVPCWVAGFAAVIPGVKMAVRAHLAWFGTAIMWFPIEPLFYDALGFSMNAVLITRIAIVLSCLLPIVALQRPAILPRSTPEDEKTDL